MILGIETSSAIASVAVGNDKEIRSELIVQAGLTHSEQLVPHIEAVLTTGKVKKSDITGIAVTIGPGSFTGLRIGLGTAKALAYAWNVPVVDVLTTDVLAQGFMYSNYRVCTVVDAQKKQVYARQYAWNGATMDALDSVEVHQAPELLTSLVNLCEEQSVVIVGDGLKRLEEEYTVIVEEGRIDPMKLVIGHESKQRPRASHVIQVALPQFASGNIPDAQSIEPFYIRKSEAEVVWDEKHKDILATGTYVEPTVIVREAAGER